MALQIVPPSPAAPAPTAASSSNTKTPRINVVDALRGFALLGILIMNIQSFAMPEAAYINPMAFGINGNITGSANGWAYIFSHLFADQKFMTIFSLLFGFSMAMMYESNRSNLQWWLYKRNALLLVIGCLHAYLIWHGDILVTYALCGFFVTWLLRLSTGLLISTGCFLILVPVLLLISDAVLLSYWTADDVAAIQQIWQPDASIIKSQIEQLQGSWWQQLPHRVEKALEIQLYLFPLETGWRVVGLMLWGAALYRLQWAQQPHPSGKIRRFAMPLLMGGLAIIAVGIQQNHAHNWRAEYSFFVGYLFNYIGSVLVAFAYIGFFTICYQRLSESLLMCSLQAVGRTALSNYLLQSLICSWLFYGHGLGWFASFDRLEQLVLLPAIWSAQVMLTLFWLKVFQTGPVEWLWRSGVDGKFRSILRRQ